MSFAQRTEGRLLRKARLRKKMLISEERPRLSVFRSGKHIYAQIINDLEQKTLVAASTLSKELKSSMKKTATIEAAQKVGSLLAKKALEKKISKVVFDRNGFLYHGRVKALAESARKEGLKF